MINTNDLINKLKTIPIPDDDKKEFRKRSYSNVIDKLIKLNKLYITQNDLSNLNLTEHMIKKINEIKPVGSKITYDQVKKIQKVLEKFGNVHITGSFRRKKEELKDIDIMLVNENVDEYLKYLKKHFEVKIVTKGTQRISAVLDNFYKIDIFVVDKNEFVPQLLYSTGSKENNILMRSVAKKLGYLLNQHGLFYLSSGEKITGLKTEKDYYTKLKMKYLEPEER